jgi:hypothetical protein
LWKSAEGRQQTIVTIPECQDCMLGTPVVSSQWWRTPIRKWGERVEEVYAVVRNGLPQAAELNVRNTGGM